MANTYKDIIITPFRADANNDPVIKFSSGDATSNVDMNVRFYATSNGTLSFEGTSGQLFSVTNDLTGTIFSVNDISGIPSIEVDAAGKISMAHFGGNVGIGTANATSKLHVVGTANISSTITASGVDLLSNDYSTYLMAKGGIDGANTINTTQTTNITNLTTGLTGSNTNITNLTTGLVGANTNIATKDSVANVYITWNYLNANITSFASYANTTFTTNAHIDTKIAAIIDSSPAALNTLRELANALGNDSSFSTTVLTQIGTISANTIALQGGLSGANTAISTKDSVANVYATYLMAKGGIEGANTVNTTQTTNITNLTTGLAGSNTNITNFTTGLTGANTNITNLTTGLTGSNTNLSGNVAIFNGAFTGSNTRLSGAESNVIALQGGLAGANTVDVNQTTGLVGANTNITNLTTGLTGANTNINLKANAAAPVFTGNATFDTDVLFVDSLNDRVGISNTNPQHKLSVNGSIHIPRGDNDRIWSGPNNLRLGDYPQLQVSDTLSIFGGQQKISFGGTGNYATIESNQPWDFVKTTTAQAIRIYGTYTDASNYERLLVSSNSTASYVQSQAVGTGTARDLYLGANNATVVTVAANGNVGIGTTSPSTKFHAVSGGNVLKFPQTDGGDVGLQIESGGAGHAPSVHLKNSAGYFRLAVYSSDGSFRAYNGTDRLTILQDGNVGIGTSSPTSNLHVIGTANISTTITASGVNLLSNDYSTYLMALGGLTGANTNITNLTTGLTGANTNITNLTTGLAGANTNITNLQTGLTGANTNITLRATLANPTFTGVVNIPNLTLTAAGGIEGGQLDLANAITNTTITTGIAIDIYGDKVRIFEKGGTNRGAYLDLSAASVGIGSNLLAGSSNTVSEPISYIVQSYVTSSINTYPIGTTVSSVGNVSVYLNGVYQNKNQYVLSNSSSNVQFTDTTLPTSLSLEIVTIGAPTILSSHIVQSYVTSSINTYPIGVTVSSVNNVFVHLNGVYQNKNQYVLSNSSSNVQFTDATLTSSLSLEIITIR